MKTLILFLLLSFSLNSQAVYWKVYGPCDEKPVHQGQVIADLEKSVGAISIQVFDANKIPYIGSDEGLNSVINTPTDLNSIEVVSDRELRAYGWCYSINGQNPSQMPHELKFSAQSDELIWFYAYSTNKDNKWMDDYCTPAYLIKAKQFCEK